MAADPISQALSREEIFRKALFERPESLSQLLPYNEWIEEGQIFCQKDGSLGVVFEATLVEHEPLTSEGIISKVDSLRSWLSLPGNCVLQVLYDQSYLSRLDQDFGILQKEATKGHPVSKRLFATRLKQIKDACSTQGVWAPLSRRTFVSLRYFPYRPRSFFPKDMAKPGDATLYRELAGFSQGLAEFRQLTASFEKNSKVGLRRLSGKEFVEVLRRFFNPKTFYKREFAPFNPNLSISDQLLYQSPTLDHVGIEREGLQTRTLSLKTSPQFAYPGGMAYFTKLPFPFRLSLSFSFPSDAKVKRFFDVKEFFLENTPSARARRQKEEVLEVQERLARGEHCANLTFNVILEGESNEELESQIRDVVNLLHHDLECEAIVETDIGLGLCLNSLPLHYTPQADYSSQRFIRILHSDATKFIPIFDSFRGLTKPLQLYLSRENNLVRFSLLENETSNHTVVLADTGSGKSAFVIDCVQAAKRQSPEPLIFVIDKKSSYLMLSEFYDADLTVFDRKGDVPFSPFRGVYDEDKIAFLTQLILTAVQLTSPKFVPESEHQAAISKALKLAYVKKLRQAGLIYVEGELHTRGSNESVELSMDDFVAELGALPSLPEFAKFREIVELLSQKLKPFYGDGIYSKFFNRSLAPQAKSKLFYIYDLDALDSDSTLQTLMTLSVFEEIRQTIALPEHKGRGGFIVFEEFAMVGRNNPTASKFMIDFAETLRKYGYWLIALTPRPQNYFDLEVGQALWGVADNFVFLQMSEDNVEYLAKRSGLLDEANKEIIKSLRTVRGKYADVYYLNKKKSKQGAFRFVQTPLDRWLAPTNAKDASAAGLALKKHPNDKWKALTELAERFPEGCESGESA